MSGYIGVINAGSSSVKFALYDTDADVSVQFRGQVEGIGVAPSLRIRSAAGEVVAERTWPADEFDHNAATRELLKIGVALTEGAPVLGIGHRVVHGGMKYAAPIRLDRVALASLLEV